MAYTGKKQIRVEFASIRAALSKERRQEARENIDKALYPLLQHYNYVLSFASKEDEIDLWSLNAKLADEGRLLLPKVMNKIDLEVFAVRDLKNQLSESSLWKVLEPQPSLCDPVSMDRIGCILVPGLAFDRNNHRLGYGKGHYDRFLKKVECPIYGIGFREQRLSKLIPIDAHDIPMTEICLF